MKSDSLPMIEDAELDAVSGGLELNLLNGLLGSNTQTAPAPKSFFETIFGVEPSLLGILGL